MLDEFFLKILCCPECRGTLTQKSDTLTCEICKEAYSIIDGIPMLLGKGTEEGDDIRISKKKWAEFWKGFDWEREKDHYNEHNIPYIYKHLVPFRSGAWFLELGGGPSFLSLDLLAKGFNVVSIDIDLDVLRLAKDHFSKQDRACHFVCANINRLPFRDSIYDMSVGIGVLEHARNIEASVTELARVTKKGGLTFQTVPYLSFTTLITGSLRYGTVPHLPLLGSLVSVLHIKMLRMKYMRYGYEQSFTYKFLETMFHACGFNVVEVGFYDYNQTLLKRHKLPAMAFYRIMRIKLLGVTPFGDIAYIKAYR